MVRKVSFIALILFITVNIGTIFTINTQMKQAAKLEEKIVGTNAFNNITVDTKNGEITLLPTNDEKVKVELAGNDSRYELNTTVKNDTLNIYVKSEWNKIFSFDLFSKPLSLTVYIPEKEYDTIQVKSNNGQIHLTDIEGREIAVDTNNGKIGLENVVATLVKAETDNGSIRMENISGEIVGETNNGKIFIITEVLNWPLELHTDNGKIDVQSKNKPDNVIFDLQTHNGRVSVFGERDWETVIGNGDNLIKLTTKNGSITIEN